MTDARSLTATLKGQWHGSYGTACCPAHGDRHPSLSLSDGADGRLLAKCHAGCDFSSVLDALRGLGLVEGVFQGQRPDPEVEARRRQEEAAEAAKRSAQARQCWEEADAIGGTLAERYLRGRGITAELPPTLRFHPACWHLSAQRLPAMIGLVEGVDGFGVHRTYLRAHGSGKAEVAPQKAMLGSVNGGAVRLAAGGPALVAAEGIETGLSLASGMLNEPATIWAALSTSGLRALRLPARPGRLTVAADGDEPGLQAARGLLTRATRDGWDSYVMAAPWGQDWNDVLQAEAPAREAAT